MSSLFDKPIPSQRSSRYEAMRRPRGNANCIKAREHCEDLWTVFRGFADKNFRTEFALATHARWFEMYLTVSLVRAGHDISCPKPGPDVLLEADGRRIWIEATSATRGEPGKPDSVPRQEPGHVSREPTDQYVLRIRNALEEKHRKFRNYAESNIVHDDDLAVIAINVYDVDELGPHIPDHFLRSLYGRGDPQIRVELPRGRVTGVGNASVAAVRKASGADVGVRPFVDNSMGRITAMMGSYLDAFNRPCCLGDDIVLYPNLTADVPWVERVLKVGREWCFEAIHGGWEGTFVPP